MEPTAPDPICGCDCGTPSGLDWDASSQLVEYFAGDSTCSGAPDWSTIVATAACNALPVEITVSGAYMRGEAIAITAGTCDPSPSESIPALDASIPATVCLGGDTVAEGCDEGLECADAPTLGDDMCVWRIGEHECPVGYPSQTVLYDGVIDNRACGSCGCGEASGEMTGAAFRMWEGATCLIPQAHELQLTGECDFVTDPQGDNANAGSVIVNPNNNDAACDATLSPSIGGVSGANPATVCCI